MLLLFAVTHIILQKRMEQSGGWKKKKRKEVQEK